MSRKIDPKGTIEKILSVSAKLFTEKGYDKTSMQEIVEESGMSKGAIFHHFNSKEDILYSVISKQFEKIEQEVYEQIAKMQGKTAKEKFEYLLENTFGDEETNALGLIAEKTQSPPMIVAAMKDYVNKTAPILSDLMKEGIEDGSITTEYPDECAQVFILLCDVWCDPVIFESDTETLRKRMNFLQHLMKNLGVDIVSDSLIEKTLKFYEQFYREG